MFVILETHRRAFKGFALLTIVFSSLSASVLGQETHPLIEVVFYQCDSECDRETTRVYLDGRYVSERVFRERARSGKVRLVTVRKEKQLERGEVAELEEWASQPDFVNSQPDYLVKVVQDSPSYIVISHFKDGRQKKVSVHNYVLGSEAEKAKVPVSVLKFAQWAQPDIFD